MDINQAWLSIEDGIYEAKSKTELISLGYAQARAKNLNGTMRTHFGRNLYICY